MDDPSEIELLEIVLPRASKSAATAIDNVATVNMYSTVDWPFRMAHRTTSSLANGSFVRP